MLILQRRPGESILIGEDIYVEVLSVENGRVRLAIKAPPQISILRSELRTAMDANRDAAREESAPQELLDLLGSMGITGSGTSTPE